MAEATRDSTVCRLAACVLMAVLLVSSAEVARGAEQTAAPRQANEHRPKAAFLDLGGSPLAGLLEQRLLANVRAEWLERNAIEAILRERELEGLTEPAAGQQRAALGKLLKADLLVLLRQVKQPKEHVQLVVCETERGVRLAVHRVVPSKDTEADAQQLSALVEQAMAQSGREYREIAAVPPFVSHDLTYEHEHLKSAYARLVEQTVGDVPGVLTVALEEARAIAQEVGLAGGEVRRQVPLYLLGEYRHEGRDGEQKVNLKMRVMRGQEELATREAAGLSADATTEFVRRAAGELLEEAVGMRPLPPNPKLEAEQLARRAETFHLLGAWEEAAAMAEASLLLDSRQPRMHEVAASALASMTRRLADRRKGPETVARGIHLYFRALEHFEALLPQIAGRIDEGEFFRFSVHVARAPRWANLFNEHHDQPEVRRVAAELRKRELEILLRMTLARCRAQTGDEYRFLNWAVSRRPRREQFEIQLQTVRAVQHVPNAEEMIYRLSLHGHALGILDNPDGRWYLDQLGTMEGDSARRAAAELRNRLQEHLAAKAEQQPAKPPEEPGETGPQYIHFEPLHIRLRAEDGSLQPFRTLRSYIPLQQGADLVCKFWVERAALGVMKVPGRVEPIRNLDLGKRVVAGVITRITDVDYDGRFVWVATHNSKDKPRLLVIDPQAGGSWEVDEDDGLPVVATETIPDPYDYPQLWVEPLGPGKVLLVSWFGRMAIGTVTFDPQEGAKVHIFFEARHRHNYTEGEPWRDPQMAFPPDYVISFADTDKQGRPLRRALIGTGSYKAKYGRHDHPLVVDPDAMRVQVLPYEIVGGLDLRFLVCEPDALYRTQNDYMELRLERIGLPNLQPETLMTGGPEGVCIKYGNKFIVLGSRCWLLDPQAAPDKRIRVIGARPPWGYHNQSAAGGEFAGDAAEPPQELRPYRFVGIYRSNHYGLLAVRRSTEHGYEFFRIVLDDE